MYFVADIPFNTKKILRPENQYSLQTFSDKDFLQKFKEFKKEIVDKKRINFILKKINSKSKKLKIDPKITNRIWKNMILSYIDYEKRNFKKK